MAVFPVSLQQKPDSSSFQQNLQNNQIISQFDSGPIKVRQKSTKAIHQWKLSIIADSTDVATFIAFYKTTLNYGTSAFEWIDFYTGSAKNYRFLPGTTYQISNIGGDTFRISFELEEAL